MFHRSSTLIIMRRQSRLLAMVASNVRTFRPNATDNAARVKIHELTLLYGMQLIAFGRKRILARNALAPNCVDA